MRFSIEGETGFGDGGVSPEGPERDAYLHASGNFTTYGSAEAREAANTATRERVARTVAMRIMGETTTGGVELVDPRTVVPVRPLPPLEG